MALDYAIFHWLNALAGRSPSTDWLTLAAAEHLPVLVILGGCAAMIMSARTVRKGSRWVVDALAAGLFARYVIVAAIWAIVPRERPFLSQDIAHLFVVSHPSFPSAHASFLFAFSTVAFLMDRKIGIVLYAGSLLTVLARVTAGVHYPSDILAGMIVGIGSGLAIALATGLIRPRK